MNQNNLSKTIKLLLNRHRPSAIWRSTDPTDTQKWYDIRWGQHQRLVVDFDEKCIIAYRNRCNWRRFDFYRSDDPISYQKLVKYLFNN